MQDDFVYIFNHVPRTGGASLGRVLSRWFEPVWDYQVGADGAARERWLDNPLSLATLPGGSAVVGHYGGEGGRLRDRYPEVFTSPRYRLITFLRDPWQLALSYARRMTEETSGAMSPREAVLSIAGVFTRSLGQDGQPPARVLDDYWFVGTTESIQSCCDALADRSGRPRERVEQSNAARAAFAPPGELWSEFQERAADDLRLHRHVSRLVRDRP
jgi:hypothetical protein